MMKNKLLLTALILIMPLLIGQVNAFDMSVNITDVLADNYVNQENPTINYGTITEVRIRDTSQPKAYRWYTDVNISVYLPENITITYSEMCYFLSSDASTANVSVYQLYSWNSTNETNMTWNFQPCDSAFDDAVICNLTPLDEIDSSGLGYKCWNVTYAVEQAYNSSDSSVYLAWKTPETTVFTSDRFFSREGYAELVPYLYVEYETDVAPVNQTNLSLTYSDFFAIGEENLVQANYTLYEDSLPIINATCYFNSTTGAANMTYNVSNELYEIFVIPDVGDIGIIEFSVNCSKVDLETQIETQQYFSGVFAGTPYNITIRLFENLNATTPYIDEFAYILLHAIDYNCTVVSGYEECWKIGEYVNGVAYINDTIAVGNFSIWFLSGSVGQTCSVCPPVYETVNTLKQLESVSPFVFDENRTELNLYISTAQLNWQRELIDWALTSGLVLIGLIIAGIVGVVGGLIVFTQFDKNFMLALVTTMAIFYVSVGIIQAFTGVDFSISAIMSLLLP